MSETVGGAAALVVIVWLAAVTHTIFTGRLGLWFCRIGWHKPSHTGWNGSSFRAKCSRCGYEGLIDSQGNLF